VTAQLAETYPVSVICSVLDYARSSYYYPRQAPTVPELEAAVRELAGQWPTYGYRRITAELHRAEWAVNSKRVRRIMNQLGIQGKKPEKKRRTTNSDHAFPRYPNLVEDLTLTFPDQVWVADITYLRLQTEFVYLAVLMDVFTRSIRGWHLSRALDQSLTLTALQQALADRVPVMHHSDQGVQYAATAYTDLLRDARVQISMAAVGEPTENGYAERLMRTIKEEEVDLSDYQDFTDAYRQMGQFLTDVYNRKRIHSALGYLTPAEVERAWQGGLQAPLPRA